jgi:hypothetical protein
MSDSLDACPVIPARVVSDRSRGPGVLQHEPECGLGIPASGQLPVALHGLPSLRWVRSIGASTLHSPLVGAVFTVPGRTRLCHSGSRRRPIAAVQRGYGGPSQLDGPKPERRGSASRIHRVFRGGGPRFAGSSIGPRQPHQGAPAKGPGIEACPLRHRPTRPRRRS